MKALKRSEYERETDMKKSKKIIIIIAAFLAAWAVLIAFELASRSVYQSKSDKKAAIADAKKAVSDTINYINTLSPDDVRDSRQNEWLTMMKGATFQDCICEYDVMKRNPRRLDANLWMHYKKADGDDLYFCIMYRSYADNPDLKKMIGRDYSIYFDNYYGSQAPEFAPYDVIEGKQADLFDEYEEGAYLSNYKFSSSQHNPMCKYCILIKSE